MYPQYRFMFVPIVVGVLGWAPKSLKDGLHCLGINGVDSFTRKFKVFSFSVTVKIFRTFLKFT